MKTIASCNYPPQKRSIANQAYKLEKIVTRGLNFCWYGFAWGSIYRPGSSCASNAALSYKNIVAFQNWFVLPGLVSSVAQCFRKIQRVAQQGTKEHGIEAFRASTSLVIKGCKSLFWLKKIGATDLVFRGVDIANVGSEVMKFMYFCQVLTSGYALGSAMSKLSMNRPESWWKVAIKLNSFGISVLFWYSFPTRSLPMLTLFTVSFLEREAGNLLFPKVKNEDLAIN